MAEERREVLERVAAGELTPEEALALLQHAAEPGVAARDDRPRRVVVQADLGAVSVTADPNVRDAVAVGGHTLRRSGEEVRIEGAHGGAILGDGRLLPRRGRRHALRVRIHPDLELQVRLGAGSVHLEDLRAAVQVSVDVGTATIERLHGPFDVRVASGTVSVATAVQQGQSRIATDLGSISVRLAADSHVRVNASTDAGRVSLPEFRERPAIVFGTEAETTVGSGAASLDLRATAGSITVTVDR